MRSSTSILLLFGPFLAGCALVSDADLLSRCDLDGDGVPRDGCGAAVVGDCDDGDASVQQRTFHADADGDGEGGQVTITACTPPDGFVDNDGDCDDGDPEVTGLLWYPDLDGDGYGDAAGAVSSCEGIYQYVPIPGDCDDTRDDVHPGVRDYCDDGLDNDCDGIVDDLAWYFDADGDSFGDPDAMLLTCAPTPGYVSQAGDCDDANPGINPAAPEICDDEDLDEDCNALSDDADPAVTGRPSWYVDTDGDGYGSGDPVVACEAPPGRTVGVDCDEADPEVHPGAAEVYYDGVDTNCDEGDDDDADGDGHGSDTLGEATGDDCNDADPSIHGGALDAPDDGVDQNCSGADFGLAACLQAASESVLRDYAYTPVALTGSVGSDCWDGASYEVSGMRYAVTSADLALGATDDSTDMPIAATFDSSLNTEADPFQIDLEILCATSSCTGYVSPIPGELTSSLTVVGTSLDAGETVVDVTVAAPRVSLTAGSDSVTTACAGALTQVLDFLGTSSTEMLYAAVSATQTDLEATFATDVETKVESTCRD